jgi:hypothetical protein
MQQQKLSCANCGTELMPDARFCRRCGQPSNTLGRASVTEVTTRRLDATGQPFMPGQGAAGRQSLEQQPGAQTLMALSAETQRLAPASPLKRWWPGLLLLCMVILLPTFYLLRQWRQPTIKIVRPAAPAAPAVPQPPKLPQAPAKDTTTSTSIDPGFIYPGARTTMVISKAGEGDRVQLETEDAADKVADWYMERLKPTQIIRSPENAVLRTDRMAVIITRKEGGGSLITLKQTAG